MDDAQIRGSVWTRRRMLRAAAVLALAPSAVAATLPALAPGRSAALIFANLDARATRVLHVMARHLYPHPTLDDAVYALVVAELDAAAANPAVSVLLTEGIAALDAAAHGDWLALDAPAQLARLTAIADTAFFAKVRGTAVVALYDNALAFAHFGYEGDSYGKGGYLHRGFDDLSWLPDPPEQASPGF